jgi:hypothetical protein
VNTESPGGFRTSLWFRWVAFFVAYILINILIRVVFGNPVTGGYLLGQAANAAIGATLWTAIMHFLSRRQKSAGAGREDTHPDAGRGPSIS